MTAGLSESDKGAVQQLVPHPRSTGGGPCAPPRGLHVGVGGDVPLLHQQLEPAATAVSRDCERPRCLPRCRRAAPGPHLLQCHAVRHARIAAWRPGLGAPVARNSAPWQSYQVALSVSLRPPENQQDCQRQRWPVFCCSIKCSHLLACVPCRVLVTM